MLLMVDRTNTLNKTSVSVPPRGIRKDEVETNVLLMTKMLHTFHLTSVTVPARLIRNTEMEAILQA